LDPDFVGYNPPDGDPLYIDRILVQNDGAVLIKGVSATDGGGQRPYLARLREDGTVDDGFKPSLDGVEVLPSFAIDSMNRVVLGLGVTVGSSISTFSLIRRLNADGSADPSFDVNSPEFGGPYPSPVYVSTVLALDDGKIVFGGGFISINGTASQGIIRLNTDGTVDSGFSTSLHLINGAYVIALQPSGQIVFADRYQIGRVNRDGSSDPEFTASIGSTAIAPGGIYGQIYRMAVDASGNVLISGWLSSINGVPRIGVARLMGNGTLDPDFVVDLHNAEGKSERVLDVLPMQNGNVLLAGMFQTVNSVEAPYLASVSGKVMRAPVLNFPPTDLTVVEGFEASFSVIVSSFEEPTYQWYFNVTTQVKTGSERV
jgi:uncharacterized delta-60 repeat protein